MAKDTTGRLHVTVKTGGKRKLSSKLWLERQLNDPMSRRPSATAFARVRPTSCRRSTTSTAS
jgi:23S rRNA (uridine2552-2'-O)-methyltransferase